MSTATIAAIDPLIPVSDALNAASDMRANFDNIQTSLEDLSTAIARSLIGNHISLADYCPSTPGVDCTTQVQAALDAAALAGASVYVPAMYTVTLINLPYGIKIFGHGESTGFTQLAGYNTTNMFRGIGASASSASAFLSDMSLTGNGTNTNNMFDMQVNPHHCEFRRCWFSGMNTRNALRATYSASVAKESCGFVVAQCKFFGGVSAGAIAIYATAVGIGITGIVIEDCDIWDCGSSLVVVAMNAEVHPRWGAFSGARIENVRTVGNGTGTYGTIPFELWGHDGLLVSGCEVDSATRGIGLGYVRNTVCSGNTIKNQTMYAHEVGMYDGLVIANETVKNCKTFVSETGANVSSRNLVIDSNVVDGTGLSAYSANTWFIGVATKAGGIISDGIKITNNLFRRADYIAGAIRCSFTKNVDISNNTFIFDSEYSGATFVNATKADIVTVSGNTVVFESAWTTNNPNEANRIPVFNHAGNDATYPTVRLVFDGNTIISKAVTWDTPGTILFGADTGAQEFAPVTIQNNTMIGAFSRWYGINANAGTVEILNNNTIGATFSVSDSLGTAVKLMIDGTYRASAAPTAGTWRKGDYVQNTGIASGQPKGWYCTVAGTPGTWVADANL